MVLPSLVSPWVILGILAALGGAWAAGDYHGHSAANLACTARVDAMKATAAQEVAAFTTRAREAERRLSDLSVEVEKDHADNVAALDAAHVANARLVARLGLRDPGTSSRCPGVSGIADAPGGNPSGATNGRLSIEANDFLLTESARADAAAEYGRTCHAWAMKLGQ